MRKNTNNKLEESSPTSLSPSTSSHQHQWPPPWHYWVTHQVHMVTSRRHRLWSVWLTERGCGLTASRGMVDIPGCGLGYPGNTVRGGPNCLHCTRLCDLERGWWEWRGGGGGGGRWVAMSTAPHKLLLLQEIKMERQRAAVERCSWDAVKQNRRQQCTRRHLQKPAVLCMLTNAHAARHNRWSHANSQIKSQIFVQ